MDEDDFAAGRRREEAAQWFARLKTLPVSQGTLNDFFAWRRQRENAEAFEEAERFWSQAEKVGDRPSILRAIEEADQRARSRPRRGKLPRPYSILVIGIAAVLVICSAVLFLGPRGLAFSTGTGEQRTIALADGSRLNLNVETDIGVDYRSSARNLELRNGEALFSVAHEDSRPFVVTAGAVTITATGTRFDVTHRAQRTAVTLIQGAVTVRAANGSTAHLRPGQQWLSSPDGMSLRTVSLQSVTAWTQGRVLFDNVPLTDALAEINRHGGKLVVLDTPQFAGRRISGSFEAGDTDSFVTAVTAFLPLRPSTDQAGRIHLADKDELEKKISPSPLGSHAP
ncbi:FecR family protein [Sphingobium sp. YR657]|uniref:FecR family protein n=1 Tax=Sphingobium sp. YR657 TaxID=1884366 RepID=UPI000920C30A|nr:FecR domain-containing protein [Sphingobium sp. YR657]SHL51664.1 FecR family protein [Sphingobium sp. YR657]